MAFRPKPGGGIEMTPVGGSAGGPGRKQTGTGGRRRAGTRRGTTTRSRERRETTVDSEDEELDVRMTLRDLELALVEKLELRKNMRQFFFFCFFIVVFMSQVFLARAPREAFNSETALKDVFIDEEFEASDSQFYKSFLDVKNMDEIWQWIEGPLINQLTANEWYNGKVYDKTQEGFIYMYNKVIGGIRVRQLRVKANTCTVPERYSKLYPNCFPNYQQGITESRDAYGPGGMWKWKSPEETRLPSFIGRATSTNVYDGGGFVVDIPYNRTTIPQDFAQLKRDRFLDRQTRALFITLNFFNQNENHFITLNTLFEMTPGGLIKPWYVFKVVRLELYTSALDIFRGVLEFMVASMLVYFTQRVVREALAAMHEHHSLIPYLQDSWNLLDIINLTLFWYVVVENAAWLLDPERFNVTLDMAGRTNYIPLEPLAARYINLYNVNAFNVFLTWIKTFKFLKINDRIFILWKTMSRASGDLFAFLIFFTIIFVGFAFMGTLLFGPTMTGYRDFLASVTTLGKLVVGQFEYLEYVRANRVLGPVFFFLFVVLVYFTLVNMFIAIINDAFTEVKGEVDESARKLSYQLRKGMQNRIKYYRTKIKGEKHTSRRALEKRVLAMVRQSEFKDSPVTNIDDIQRGMNLPQEDAELVLTVLEQYREKKRSRREAEITQRHEVTEGHRLAAGGAAGAAGASAAGGADDSSSRTNVDLTNLDVDLSRLLANKQTKLDKLAQLEKKVDELNKILSGVETAIPGTMSAEL